VLVEGKNTNALLDTGSSVTILSLNFIINHWAQQRKEGQTVEQLKGRGKESTTITKNYGGNERIKELKNYGGNEIDFLKETSVNLERGGYSCTQVVLLQKNPPYDLLIGTDFLPSLGFQISASNNSQPEQVQCHRLVQPEQGQCQR